MIKSIFLTGATGNIGAKLVELLLNDTQVSSVYLLVRSDSPKHGLERIRDALTKSSDSIDWDNFDKKVRVISGDMCKPLLGLSIKKYHETAKNITHVIHAAAETKFTVSIDKIRKVNLEGTKEIVRFAKCAYKNKTFEGMAYISTAFVNGHTHKSLDEQTLVSDPKFHNTYEQSKWETEHYLRSMLTDLPLCVFRPSIVVGDSQTGKLVHYNVLYTPLRVLRTKRIPVVFAGPKVKLDIVPVDYVAKGIKSLFVDSFGFHGATYNLVSGKDNSPTIKHVISTATDSSNEKQRIHFIPSFFYRLLKPIIMRKFSAIAKVLETFMPYMQSGSDFDRKNTHRLLQNHNVVLPETDRYMAVVINHFFSNVHVSRLRKAM